MLSFDIISLNVTVCDESILMMCCHQAMAPSVSCGSGGYSGIAAAGGASAAGPVPSGEQELWWQSDAGPLVMDGYYHKRPINCSNDAVVRSASIMHSCSRCASGPLVLLVLLRLVVCFGKIC